MKLISKITIIFALSALALGAFAQRGGGGMRGGFMNKYMLLNMKDVQTDMKLSDDQVAKLKTLSDQQREDMRSAMENARASGDMSSMGEARKKINDEYKPKYDAVLNAEQMTRLDQLFLQFRKGQALSDADLQQKLGMTEDQKGQVETLFKQQQDANRALFEKVRNQEMTQDDAFAAFRKNNDILSDQLMKILTPDQQAKLTAMEGAPFQGKFDTPQFGRRRGGGA